LGANTKIEWADHTFNPWRGCTKVSEACRNCYAEKQAKRNPNTLGIWGPEGTRVVAAEAAWKKPLKWDREAKSAGVRRRVFCASMADVFEDWQGPMHDSCGNRLHEITDGRPGLVGGTTKSTHWYSESPCDDDPEPWLTMTDVRRRLFELIDATPNLDWLLLTKRPENIAAMMPVRYKFDEDASRDVGAMIDTPVVRHNVWLGTTVENQQAADERIPHLLRVPARVRFLSCEPMLGPINLSPYVSDGKVKISQGIDCDWVIAGGESGPHARPMHPDWVRSLRDQCVAAGVPFHFKQWGEWCASGERDGQQVFRQFASKQQWVNKSQSWMSPGDVCLDADGRECKSGADFESAKYPVTIMRRVGKAAAGRMLDGREWDELPTNQQTFMGEK